jgi:hypothetical protein
MRVSSSNLGGQGLDGLAHDLQSAHYCVLPLLIVMESREIDALHIRLDKIGTLEDVREVERRVVTSQRIRISSPRIRSRTSG